MSNLTDDNLKKYLKIIESNFNIKRLIGEEQQNKQIRDYYLINHFAYLVFHNRKGFMHMGLSKNNKYSDDDLLGQLKIIQKYIEQINAQRVLELGAGNGSNSLYLAKNNQGVNFIGIDLSKEPSNKKVPNYKQDLGDFHNLNEYTNESFDLVFVIEALCHSRRKAIVLNEVYKKLRKKGLFIIFDGYVNKPLNQLTDDEILAKELTEKTMAVDSFHFIDDFEKVVKKSNFSILTKKDLSQEIIPSLKRFEKLALLFYKLPLVTNLIKFLLPRDVVKNSVAGLLMPTLVQKKVVCYYMHVLKKN